jgi:hypothetical protein
VWGTHLRPCGLARWSSLPVARTMLGSERAGTAKNLDDRADMKRFFTCRPRGQGKGLSPGWRGGVIPPPTRCFNPHQA